MIIWPRQELWVAPSSRFISKTKKLYDVLLRVASHLVWHTKKSRSCGKKQEWWWDGYDMWYAFSLSFCSHPLSCPHPKTFPLWTSKTTRKVPRNQSCTLGRGHRVIAICASAIITNWVKLFLSVVLNIHKPCTQLTVPHRVCCLRSRNF